MFSRIWTFLTINRRKLKWNSYIKLLFRSVNRTDIILSCFLRLISIFSILLFIQTLVGLGEFEATVGAQVSMSIENCPLTPSLPEGFEEAKGPGEGVGRSILVEPQ